MVKLSATLVVVLVSLVACGGSEERAGEDTDIVTTPTTANAPGAPCQLGQKRECKQTIAERDGIVSCYVGEQTCDDNGVWGACRKEKK